MPASSTGPFYVAADALGRDIHEPQVTYTVGRGAPGGRIERRLLQCYTDPAQARRVCGPDGQVFQVRGTVAATTADGQPLLRSCTVVELIQ